VFKKYYQKSKIKEREKYFPRSGKNKRVINYAAGITEIF